jgi:hypothetical protein
MESSGIAKLDQLPHDLEQIVWQPRKNLSFIAWSAVNKFEIMMQIVNGHRDVLAEHGDLHAHHRVVVPSALRHFKMPFGAKHAGGHWENEKPH